MKKIIYTLSIFLCLNATLSAQWINSIQYQPSNPTASDTVTFYVALSFPSGTCDQHTQGININGNKIEAFALHCLGMLTYICNHTDTFKVNPLPAGLYSFHFQLDAGMLPSPCTPGIISGPSDSITFVVSPVTGINQVNEELISVFVKGNDLIIESHQKKNSRIFIYDLNGKLIRTNEITNDFLRINIALLSKGKYLYSVTSGNKVLKEGDFFRW